MVCQWFDGQDGHQKGEAAHVARVATHQKGEAAHVARVATQLLRYELGGICASLLLHKVGSDILQQGGKIGWEEDKQAAHTSCTRALFVGHELVMNMTQMQLHGANVVTNDTTMIQRNND